MSNKFVLIDLSGIAHPIYHANASNSNPNATSIAIVERIRAMCSAHPHAAICCDSGRSFRKDIDPTYKANRQDSDKDAERARIHHQIALAVDTLRTDGFPIWAEKGFEADDLIATAVHLATTHNGLYSEECAWCGGQHISIGPEHCDVRVLVISSDKDLRQLVSDRVEVFAPSIGNYPSRTYDVAGVLEKHGVQPHQLLDYLALVGDTSDNIVGAKGIGEKTAANLLNTFGNLDDLFAAIDKGEAKIKEAGLKSLAEFRPRMETVRSLIRLRTDAPIAFEEIFKERVPQEDIAVFLGELDMNEQSVEDRVEQASAQPMAFPFNEANVGTIEQSPAREPHANIAAALAAAQGIIQHADKDSNNPFFNSKYADLASVWTACRKPLSDNGIAVVQSPETVFMGTPVFEVKTTTRGERLSVKVITKVRVVTRLLHASGESIDNVIETLLPNGDPQSIGSAITYLRRYALASLVGVAPEDDDGEAATRVQPSLTQRDQAIAQNAKR